MSQAITIGLGRLTLSSFKGAGSIPASALRDRFGTVIFDRAGLTIDLRS